MRHHAALLALLFLVAPAAAAGEEASLPSRRFPVSWQGGVARVDAERFEALRGLDAVRILGVPVRDTLLTLRVRRVVRTGEEARLRSGDSVEPLGELARHVLLFRGRVEEAPASRAFLALSPAGAIGWVRLDGERIPIGPADDGDSPLGLPASSSPAAGCQIARVDQPLAVDPSWLSAQAQSTFFVSGSQVPTLLARVAVETDHQFFQLFGDATLAGSYALALLGAVSDLYEEELGVRLEVVYLGIHPEANDPWHSQDAGGDALSVLLEFRQAWKNGKAPAAADAHLFLSGADLGGGIAYLNALCSPAFSFAVAGDLSGQAAFPPTGQTAWDPLVVAHELGHVFVTPHTHDYCPPLDECAPPPYFGACQGTQDCVPDGTIMSYCHLCPGGLANVALAFHPTVAAAIRQAAEGSCLEEIVPPHSLCSDATEGLFAVLDPDTGTQHTFDIAVADCGTSSDAIAVSASFDPPVSWAAVTPASGTVGPDALPLSVSVDVSGLAFGTHTTTLRVSQDLDPSDAIEIPLAVTVLPPPFLSKDRLVGSLEGGDDVDQARVEVVHGARLRLQVDASAASAPLRVELRDVHDLLLAQWSVAPGKHAKLEKKVSVDGPLLLVCAGQGVGSYAIDTKVKWPKKAKPKVVKKKPAHGTDFVEVLFRASSGATLDVSTFPKAKDLSTAGLLLLDPSGDEVDLSGHLDASGLALAGLPLSLSGDWRLRVTGVSAPVKIRVEPRHPKGGGDVPID